MGRKRKNVYLGTDPRVPDTGKPGLDNLTEVERISAAIVEDYREGKISRRKAARRLTFLENFVLPRDSDFKGKKLKKAQEIVDDYLDLLDFL